VPLFARAVLDEIYDSWKRLAFDRWALIAPPEHLPHRRFDGAESDAILTLIDAGRSEASSARQGLDPSEAIEHCERNQSDALQSMGADVSGCQL
jgi:hypothetical protein